MKDRPILFSAPMVRALLDGSKTQTRRLCKPANEAALSYVVGPYEERADLAPVHFGDEEAYLRFACPYGQPGDRLWVRETFRLTDTFDPDSPARVAERCIDAGNKTPWAPIQYEADGAQRDWHHVGMPPHDGTSPKAGKTRVSIHMPRWASRILLEIVSVRVERLHDLSEADAIAEGIEQMPCEVPNTRLWRNYRPANGWTPRVVIPQNSFRSLWESINGEEDWLSNPWVWVVEFKRVAP